MWPVVIGLFQNGLEVCGRGKHRKSSWRALMAKVEVGSRGGKISNQTLDRNLTKRKRRFAEVQRLWDLAPGKLAEIVLDGEGEDLPGCEGRL
ncbi:hypothetical protein CEXT_300581 [Caerostris extrusa]|uniref:Uncharacterized protein n=1 Tax=Caerostris extrusa TaxID=172846 RepID=A0AAV4Q4U6_CAEEX|nr:hypothetical protein CEXT_300581 [Caerostris extrusa]